MSASTKRIVAIATVAILILSTAFATYSLWSNPSSNTSNQLEPMIEPLDTKSKKVYATYQGGSVTEGEVNLYLNIFFMVNPNPMLAIQYQENPDYFKQLIAKHYAAKKYLASKVKLTPAIKDETNKQLELIKKALENQQEKASNDIEEVLEKHGFNSEQLRKFIERELLVDNALEDRIKDIEFDFVSVNHVLVGLEVQQPPSPDGKQQPPTKRSDEEAKKRAQEVFKKLQETKGDFKTIAKEYSDDPGSKDMEGKYEGDVSQFVKEFKDAALTLPIGKISDPVKTEFGYHVMRVNERKKMKVGQASEDIKETYKGNVFAELQDKELNFQLKVPPAKQPAPTPEQTPPAPTPEQSNQPNSPPAPSANPPQQQAPQPPAPPKP